MATAPGLIKIFSPWVYFCRCGSLRRVQGEEIVSPQGENVIKKEISILKETVETGSLVW